VPDGRVSEVISVISRRRRFTPEQKLALVAEVSKPGVSVAALADRHGVSRSLLFEWRRQVREGLMPGVTRVDGSPAMVPVSVVAEPRPKEMSPFHSPGSPQATAMIEVVLTNGRVLRFPEAIRPDVLGRLAAALDG